MRRLEWSDDGFQMNLALFIADKREMFTENFKTDF